MNDRLSSLSRAMTATLTAAVLLTTACGSNDSGAAASGSASTKPDSSAKAANSAAPKPSAVASATAAPKKEGVNLDKILDQAADDKNGSGALKVDLSTIDTNAPLIGGGDPPPVATPPPSSSAAASADKPAWLEGVGDLIVFNPGWTKSLHDGIAVLIDPTKAAGLVFTTFTDTKDGQTKVDKLVQAWGMKDARWKDSLDKYTVGPNHLPALMGVGQAKEKDGKGVKLFYFLVQTGAKDNLLFIGGVDDGGDKALLNTAINIVGSVKKKQ